MTIKHMVQLMAKAKSKEKVTEKKMAATPSAPPSNFLPLWDVDEAWIVPSYVWVWTAWGSSDGDGELVKHLDAPHDDDDDACFVCGFLVFGWKKSYAEGENAIGFS